MKKTASEGALLAILLIASGLLASCATFSIKNASVEDAREAREYVLRVDAWDKKAPSLSVVFVYRVNSGEWKEISGNFNGSSYEARVPASELSPGTLEYYAWMINAKGKKVSSRPARIPIFTFEQAKANALKSYASRLSDGGSPKEFIYNKSATLKLGIGPAGVKEALEPASVECTVIKTDLTQVVSASLSGGVWSATVSSPHAGSSLSYQWRVRWNDAEFGQLDTQWPAVPASIPVLDQLALNQRIVSLFEKSFVHYKNVAGSYFDPPVVEAELNYDPLTAEYSADNRSVFLVIHRGSWSSRIKMNEVSAGRFRVGIPVRELESGPVSYSFEFSDVFSGPGLVSAAFPRGKALSVTYRSYAELLEETESRVRASLTHAPPVDVFEQKPIVFSLGARDPGISISSMRLEGSGLNIPGNSLVFTPNGSTWTAGIPAAFVRSGPAAYRIIATVRDERFGEFEVTLPETGFYTLQIQSLAALKALKEAELARSSSHQAPVQIKAGEILPLQLSTTSPLPGLNASLFFRTGASGAFRELRGQPVAGGFVFTIAAADTTGPFIQYYFTLSAVDSVLGSISVSIKDGSSGGPSGGSNDFVVAPASAPVPAPVP